jgi:hypothetical protein
MVGKGGKAMQICGIKRRFLVHQVLRTMALDFLEDDYGYTVVDDGQWAIYLPDDDTSIVVIAFNQESDPAYAGDITSRFCKLPDLAGLNVVVAPSFAANDSTGTTTVETVH